MARIGLALVGLGVSALVPGLWEQVFDCLVTRFDPAFRPAAQSVLDAVNIIGAVVAGAGLVLISACSWLYHRQVANAGPSTENDGAISVRVQSGASLRRLVETIADQADLVVDFDGLDSSQQRRPVRPGLLSANDFESFLGQIADRCMPPLPLAWSRQENQYRLRAR